MDSLYDGRILLLLFIGGVFHLILYFTKNNSVISAQAFRKSLIICWGVVLVLIVAVLSLRRPFRDRLRVACFPVGSSEKWLDMVIADGINDVLKSVDPGTILAYPMEWMYDAIDKDSTYDIHYLQAYGKRIELDFLIVLQGLSRLESGYSVEWSLYDLNENRCLRTDTDSIYFRQSGDFFTHIAKDILVLASAGDHAVYPPVLPAPAAWEAYGWGRYHKFTGEVAKAENDFRTAVAIDPNDQTIKKALASVLVEKAVRLQAQNNFAEDVFIETVDLLQQVLEADSSDAEAYRILGDVYIQSERWNKAENALQKAFYLDEDNPLIYWSMSRIHPSRYTYSGFKSKMQLLQRAVRMNPAFERARLALGDDRYYKNKPGDAEAIYKGLLWIHPRSLDGLLALGKLYVSRNDILHIIHVYEKVLEISPAYADAYYNLGIAYYNDDKVDEAAGFFKKAIDIDNHADSYLYLGIIHAEKGESEQAMACFRHRIRLRNGVNDPYAEEARRQLNRMIQDGESIP